MFDAVLVTHGAGSGATHPTSLALERAFSPIPVRRMEFPYRAAGRRAPDRAPALTESILGEVDALTRELGTTADRVLIGGRSMGGRMCSMAVAEGLPAAGLFLLSYPLHPPGRPDKLRVEHLPSVTVPTLAVSGTKDPFGTPDELQHHLSTITAPVSYVWVEGCGHEWKGRDSAVAHVVASWASALADPTSAPHLPDSIPAPLRGPQWGEVNSGRRLRP